MALSKDSRLPLNNGQTIPVSGFGLYQTPPQETTDITYKALEVGYRHIDSASFYKNEAEAAKGIAKFLKDHPEVKREDIFFTTKVVSLEPRTYDLFVEDIQGSYDRIKDHIGDIDLLLVHAPLPDKETRLAVYEALQGAYEKGYTKSIGISNYGVRHVEELFSWDKFKVKPVVNQLELHPWLPRKDLQEAGKRYDFLLEAYSPLTQGKKLDDPELVKIAQKHGVSTADVLLRWSYDQGFIPLAKTVHAERLEPNYTVLDRVTLDAEDKNILDKPGSYEVLASWDPTLAP
jgi:diketogulonate reductase-like aldo/keto reductase